MILIYCKYIQSICAFINDDIINSWEKSKQNLIFLEKKNKIKTNNQLKNKTDNKLKNK